MKAGYVGVFLLGLCGFAPIEMFASAVVEVGIGEIGYVGTNGVSETLSHSMLIEGELRKVGAGTNDVPAGRLISAQGRVTLVEGGLRVETGGTPETVAAPAELLAQAAMWFSADTNVVTSIAPKGDGSSVTNVLQWLDVREAGPDGPFQYCRAVSQTNYTSHTYTPEELPYTYSTNLYPTLKEGDTGNGQTLPYVDFGGYHSGQWMAWHDAASNSVTPKAYHLFAVHACFELNGWLFGYDSALPDLHIGHTLGQLIYPLWLFDSSGTCLRAGRTFLNRREVDGSLETPATGYQLLNVEMGAVPSSRINCFFRQGTLYPAAYARAGGERLCEVLVFTNRITEAERLRIQQYLWQKWMPPEETVPTFGGQADAELQFDIAQDDTLAPGVQGSPAVVKTGEGTLLLNDTLETGVFSGRIRLDQGALDLRVPAAVEAAGGTSYSSAANVLTTSATNSGTMVKTGNGELILRAVPSGISRLSVAEGTLQIDQGLDDGPPLANAAGTFEDPSMEKMKPSSYYTLNATPYAGWTGYVLSSGGSPRYYSTVPFPSLHSIYPAPEGRGQLVLKHHCAAETAFSLPAAGVYILSFWISGRAYQYQDTALIIDGEHVATVKANDGYFQRCRYRLPWLAAGSHTLRLENLYIGDWSAAFDAFRLDMATAATVSGVISNASFEVIGMTTGTSMETNAAATGWTFETDLAATNLALTVTSQSPYCPALRYGRRALVIKNSGKARTTMTFAQTGMYALRINIARIIGKRAFDNADTWGVDNHLPNVVEVFAGTRKVASLSTLSTLFTEVVTDPFDAEADVPLTLSLEGTATDNRLLAIDDIRADQKFELVANGGFEDETGGWVYIGDPTETKPLSERHSYTTAPTVYGTNRFEGEYCLKLCDSGLAKQTVTFGAPGTYRFVCHANSREDGDHFGRNPVAVWIARNGVTNSIGHFNTYDRIFRRHAFLFAVPEAGDYEIGIEGQTPWILQGENPLYDRTSRIDLVSVTPVQVAELGTPLPKELGLEIAEGAKLVLNYFGTCALDSVRHNGQSLTGIISHASNPNFIFGAGVLYVPAKGTLIRLH